jgi:hypothetical protein
VARWLVSRSGLLALYTSVGLLALHHGVAIAEVRGPPRWFVCLFVDVMAPDADAERTEVLFGS